MLNRLLLLELLVVLLELLDQRQLTVCWGAMTRNKGLFDLPLALTWISCICRERQLVVIGITTWVVRTGISSDLSSMGIML